MDSLAVDRTGAPLERESTRSASGVTLAGVYACFFLSGFAALLYQTAWLRQFSIVFGTSDLAVGAVLAAYMAGLALGASIGGRLAPHIRRPVLVYALLELAIAGAALLVPVALRAADGLLVSTIGGRPDLVDAGGFGPTAFYLVTSFVVLLLPTALMGATLPMLARYAVRREEQIGSRVGSLYATNTAGAVLGTLVAAFVLLPRYGLSGTVWWGVGVNALVFVLAAALGASARPTEDGEPTDRPAPELLPGAGWVLPWMLVAGAVSFTYEVLWTRLLSHLLGASVYAFATMLAAFLAGIAIGSAIAARLATTRRRAAHGLVVAQLATALLSVGVYWLIDRIPEGLASEAGEHAGLAPNAAVAMIVLLPATLCIGATFPFALRLLARDEHEAALASGRVYAWNTVGAIVGAVLASFFVIPSLGFGGTTKLAVSINAALGLAAALLWMRERKGLALASAAVLAGAVVVYWPSAPEHLLVSSPFVDHRGGTLLYEGVGRTSSVAIVETEDHYYFRCNGLPEGGVTPRGAPPFGRLAERWLTILPALARPEARSMMVVGLGAGTALENVPPQFETIDVIELEPRVVDANRAIADRRDRDPLADPRLRIVHQDARGALALTTERWDAIVNQPSHPWTAGASHLYTVEFLRDVRRHLTDRGVFVQWIQTSLLTEDLLRSIAATVGEAFEHVRMYRPIPNMLIFLASPAPLDVELELARTGAPLASAPDFYARSGIFGPSDVVAMLALDEEGVRRIAEGAPVVTDDRNALAMESTHALGGSGTRQTAIDPVTLAQLLLPYDPIVNRATSWASELEGSLDEVYLVYRLIDQSLVHRALLVTQTIPDPSRQLTAMGFLHWRGGFSDIAQQHWVQALETDPQNATARFATIMRALSLPTPDGENAPEVLEIAEGLPEPAMAVVHGWRHFRKNDWVALSELEDTLAQATPMDLWYQEACRLRATWRVMLPTEQPEEHVRRAREAVALIDRGTILHPDPLSYLVRMTAAMAAQYPGVLLESVNQLAHFLTEWKVHTPEHIQVLIRTGLAQLQPALVELGKDERIPPERLEAVARRVEAALAQP